VSKTTPRAEECGHCEDGGDTETQGHSLLCFKCGRYSNHDGTPIQGNAHHRANYSKTFPEANRHGISDF
jgi:hypothetical protein